MIVVHSAPKQDGFTILELVAVIVIASALFITLDLDFVDEGVDLEIVAQRLTNDIRFIQSRSMQRNDRFRINFSATGYRLSDRTDSNPVFLPGSGGDTVTLKTNQSLSVNGVVTNNYLVFDGLGQPYTTDAIPGALLAANAVITLTMGAASVTVTVVPETGGVVTP